MKYPITYLLVLCIIGITSCNQSNLPSIAGDSYSDTNASNRSLTSNTYFVNTETGINEESGDVWATGELQCTETTDYTFTFAYNGTSDVMYCAQIGTNLKIMPTNGGNFRSFTVTLEPGIHRCYVELFFSCIPSYGELRLVITHINGSTSSTSLGNSDLSVSGSSRLNSNPVFENSQWTCPNCHSLNSIIRTNCIMCNTSKPTND